MKKFLILFPILVFVALIANAQVIDSVNLKINKVSITSPFKVSEKTVVFTNNLSVFLSNTNGISKINVKLGTRPGRSDIFEKSFAFSEQGNLSDGTSFQLDGNIAKLKLGSFTHSGVYYSEVNLEYTNGAASPAVRTTGNQ